MSKNIHFLTCMMVCGSMFFTACILEPRTSYPNTDQINDTLLTEYPGGQEDGDQAVVCFVQRELLPVAFSPDNSQIILRSSQGVEYIDLDRGMETAFYQAPLPITAAALSPDGRYLAWALEDNNIQIVRVSDATTRYSMPGHPDPVLDLRFSPAEPMLFSASHDGIVRKWNVDSGSLVSTVEVGSEVVGIGVSHDGSTLATAPSDGPITLWNTLTSEFMETLGGTGGFDTSDPIFSMDGNFLAADLAVGLMIWNLADGSLVWDEAVNSLAASFSPDGRWFAYSDIDGNNQILLIPSDFQGTERTLDQMQAPVWELFFSADGTLLAATDGVEIRIWRVSDGDLIAVGKSTCP